MSGRNTIFGLVFLLPLSSLFSCASSRHDEPLAGPLVLNEPKLVAGRQIFMRHCYQCHPGGSAGLGPAINDKPLPGGLIKTQVRKGLGAMPAFDDKMIQPPNLDNLVAYLQALRKHTAE